MPTWDIHDDWNCGNLYYGCTIELLTLEQLQSRDPESIVVAIDGTESMVKDADTDTRWGYTAYGDLVP